jgi:hypothetical protein
VERASATGGTWIGKGNNPVMGTRGGRKVECRMLQHGEGEGEESKVRWYVVLFFVCASLRRSKEITTIWVCYDGK